MVPDPINFRVDLEVGRCQSEVCCEKLDNLFRRSDDQLSVCARSQNHLRGGEEAVDEDEATVVPYRVEFWVQVQ